MPKKYYDNMKGDGQLPQTFTEKTAPKVSYLSESIEYGIKEIDKQMNKDVGGAKTNKSPDKF